MPKPACSKCLRFFRPKHNGFYFIEGMPVGTDTRRVQPGTAEPENWKPYKLWVGDLWECKGCGAEILVGSPSSCIAWHHESNFDELVALYGATLQINDC